MLKIYHAPMTRSLRVIWLCEELGLPITVEPISFHPDFRFSQEWLARNPVGKVPVLEDDDFSMFESGAMMQYILDRYGNGRLQPLSGATEHAEFLQWNWFAESTFCRPLGEIVNHRRNFDPPLVDVVAEMSRRAEHCVQAIDAALRGREYIMGEFSAADIMLGYSFILAENFTDILERAYPNVQDYWRRLKARPAANVLAQDFHS